MAVYNERIPQVKQWQPKKKGNRRLLALLVLFFLTVLAVVFFRSPYSKVSEIRVFGNTLYENGRIIAASGLAPGMQFLNVWQKDVQEGAKQLQGVREIAVKRHFPGVIDLNVTEYKRVAFMTTPQGACIPLLENGVLLTDADNKQLLVDRPLIRSWNTTDPQLLINLAQALAKLSPAILAEISDISLTPTAYDKERVTLYMRDGNEVQSVIHQLAKKLVWYPAIVKQIPDGQKGVVYLLESTWFSRYGSEEQEELPEGSRQPGAPQPSGTTGGSGTPNSGSAPSPQSPAPGQTPSGDGQQPG